MPCSGGLREDARQEGGDGGQGRQEAEADSAVHANKEGDPEERSAENLGVSGGS